MNQFDIIQLLTTNNVKYLSARPGHPTTPHGTWSIVGFIENDIIACKDSTLIRIPVHDVVIVGHYTPPFSGLD